MPSQYSRRQAIRCAFRAAYGCMLVLFVLASNPGVAQTQWTGSASHWWWWHNNWSPAMIPLGGDVDLDVVNPHYAVVSEGQTALLDTLRVGVDNEGRLVIVSGGTARSAEGIVGTHPGSSGRVEIIDPGSVWEVSQNLRVGKQGDGLMSITHGSGAQARDVTVGQMPGGDGRINVLHPGSSLEIGQQLGVGTGGFGMLLLASGATASSTDAVVGTSGGIGVLFVITEISSWTNTGPLSVGDQGQGFVYVEEGGAMETGQAWIGLSGGKGEVRVLHEGSSWSSDGDVVIGQSGSEGLLRIDAGASVTVGGSVAVGGDDQSSARLWVDGTIEVAGSIAIGENGRLSGHGVVQAPVSIGAGASIVPGGSTPGTLATGPLTLAGEAMAQFSLDTPGVTVSDVNSLVEVDGDLTIGGTVDIVNLGGMDAGTYTLFTYTGSLTDNGLAIGTLPTFLEATVDTSTSGEVRLQVTSDRYFTDRFESTAQ